MHKRDYSNLLHFAFMLVLIGMPFWLFRCYFPKNEQPAEEWKGLSFAVFGILILLFYFSITWMKVRRDSCLGPITPFFSPPMNLSPAAIRAIRFQTVDGNCFRAALMNLAVKGFIHFSNRKIIRENAGNVRELPPEEELIIASLFSRNNSEFKYTDQKASVLQRLKTQFAKLLTETYRHDKYYKENKSYWWIGFGISIFVGLPFLINFYTKGNIILYLFTFLNGYFVYLKSKDLGVKRFWIDIMAVIIISRPDSIGRIQPSGPDPGTL